MVMKRVVNLPVEMVEEILLNLPVKSLLRFSSVSKSWNTMISDAEFAKRYRGRGRERVVLEIRPYDTCWVSSSYFIIVDGAPICPVDENSSERLVCPFSQTTRLKASCTELWLALDRHDQLCLWNPSTRTFNKIPPSNAKSHDYDYDYVYIRTEFSRFGLGYDSVGDDYKILRIEPPSSLYGDGTVELYSLRSDSWRNIPHLSTHLNVDKPGVNVGGNIYWITSLASIIYFNLSTEKFGEVVPPPPLPNYSYDSWQESWGLSVLRGKLCMSLHYFGDGKIDVWAMEDNGRWTNQIRVEYSYPIKCNRALYIYENGEVLMDAAFTTNPAAYLNLVCGDKETTTQVYDDGIVEAFVYVESLAMWPDHTGKNKRRTRGGN